MFEFDDNYGYDYDPEYELDWVDDRSAVNINPLHYHRKICPSAITTISDKVTELVFTTNFSSCIIRVPTTWVRRVGTDDIYIWKKGLRMALLNIKKRIKLTQ